MTPDPAGRGRERFERLVRDPGRGAVARKIAARFREGPVRVLDEAAVCEAIADADHERDPALA